MASYPEHEKLTGIKDKSQFLGEFLEWARCNNYEFCRRVTVEVSTPWERVYYEPERKSIEAILAEFFDIDLKKLEIEKRQMIDEIRMVSKRS